MHKMVHLLPKRVKTELLRTSNVKSGSNKQKYCVFSYNDARDPLIIQTPKCRVPFGVDRNDDGSFRSITLSLNGHKTDPSMKHFVQCIERIDEDMIRRALLNGKDWFNKSIIEEDQLRELFVRKIRYKDDSTSAPMMTCKFRMDFRTGMVATK